MTWGRLLRFALYATLGLVFAASLFGVIVTGPVIAPPRRVELDVDPSPAELRRTVETLCGRFSPRDLDHPARLDGAAEWIAERLRRAGLEVAFQEYEAGGRPARNVVGRAGEAAVSVGALVIGAHYDAYGGWPGADDNASGVAVLLELARTLPAAESPRRPIYFVAFSTEEPPFFGTDEMGSYAFARSLTEEGIPVDLMVSLDLVGYYSDRESSQAFPLPFLRLFYPDRGDFIAVVGDLKSGPAIRRVKEAMLSARALAVHSFRGPRRLEWITWSDHVSFWRLGLPAVLVTDTAFLRNPHYHTPTDTPDKLDYARMAALVRALHPLLR